MKSFVIVGTMAATLLAALAAEARPLRPYERWCLNEKGGRGGDHYSCNYATYDQCMASRTTNGDWCMLNPELGSEDSRRYYR